MDDSEKLAFWGIGLKPGEPAEIGLEDGETLHVSMASFGVELADNNGRSVVTATIRNSEDEGLPEKKYALCALTAGKAETICMDVSFIGEENVTFEVTGKNSVHLVGNFSFENDIEDDSDSDSEDDGNDLIGVYDDDNVVNDEGDSGEDIPRLIMDADPPVITELSDEEEEDSKDKKAVAVKKKTASKMPNGKHTESAGKKNTKGTPGKASKDSGKKAHGKMKLDQPLMEDEEESEEESSDDTSDSEEEVEVKPKSRRKVNEVVSEDDDDDSENDEDEDEDSESEEEEIQKFTLKQSKKKSKSNKSSVVFKEVPSQNARDEDKVTPNSTKSKRQRKRGASNGPSNEVTPPQSKKSKISERPGTPAASKSGHKGKASVSAGSSRSGGSSSGKKAPSTANGVPSSGPTTPPKAGSSTPSAGSTAEKRRRRRTRKGRESS